MKINLASGALLDLQDIALHIAVDSEERAFAFVDRLEAAAVALVDAPRGFPLLPDHKASGIRRRPFQDYLIFYRVEAERIIVLRILHSARRYEAELFPDA